MAYVELYITVQGAQTWGKGKGLKEQGRLSQNRKHILQYDNLVRTTEIVPRYFKKSWNQSVKVEGAPIHLSQALVDVKGSKTVDMQNLLSRALLLLSYTLMSKGHILKAKIQGVKGEGL